MRSRTISLAFLAGLLSLFGAAPVSDGPGRDGGLTGTFTYSTDPRVAATQREVKAVVERYQAGLNAGDISQIRPLFAPDAVAEWNEKATVVGVDAMARPYEELFRAIQFTTDFQYDAVDIHGEVAVVRTHHPVGQTERIRRDGSTKLDFNREILVLKRIEGTWKIIVYTFNTQPRQGEQ